MTHPCDSSARLTPAQTAQAAWRRLRAGLASRRQGLELPWRGLVRAAPWPLLSALALLAAISLATTPAQAAGTLQAEWRLDALSGSTSADSSGNNRTLTLGSGQSLTTGLTGSGLSLPGTSGAQTAAAAIDTSNSFTVSAWVRFDTVGCNYQTVVGQDGTNVSGFFLELIPPSCIFGVPSGSARLEFMMLSSDSATATWNQAISTTTVQTGIWYHLVGVRDTATNTIRLYVNGTLEATTSYSTRWSATGRVGIGRSRWGGASGDYVDGTVDLVRLYQGAFTAAEVAALSLETIAEYRFEEAGWNGSTGEVLDTSGYGYHGTAASLSATEPTTAIASPAISGSPGTCRYGSFKRSNKDYVALPSGLPALGTTNSFTVTAWIRTTNNTQAGQRIFIRDENGHATSSNGWIFSLGDRGNGRLNFYTRATASPGTDETITPAVIANNTWYFTAFGVDFRTKTKFIRVYDAGGTQLSSVSTTYTSATIGSPTGTASIGGETNAATGSENNNNFGFNGDIDDVRVFASALSSSALTAAYLLRSTCPSLLDHVEAVPTSTSALTCASAEVTLKACSNSACTTLLSSYTGTINLGTGTGRGDWSAGSGPAPQGTLANGTADDGSASYTFVAADGGSAKLQLTHHLAQDVTVTAVDSVTPASSRTSAAIQFRDNAFVFAEDASARITGSDVVVAGRPHDMTLTLVRTDPVTGQCGTANYSGSRALKLWRSDSGGSWTAPTVVSPALTIPASQPAADNLTLSFSAGVASFNLGTSDIGRYSLNARDDSLSLAAGVVSGSSNLLTVRPFAVVVRDIRAGATVNPGGSAATDAVFTAAGNSFQATVGAYRWAAAMTGNGTDANDDGRPDAGATLTNTIAGGLAASFNSTVALAPLAASQTPAGGSLGSLSNGSVGSFSGGSATPATLQYSEVGSFALATTGVVSNFLGSGLALDATVFNAAGAQATRIGRFVPARFALSGGTVTHRSAAACTSASAFTYLGENFRLGFTLTAQNAQGGTTTNYSGSFARLDPASAAAWALAGIGGSTPFSTSGASPRLALGSASGSWVAGVASGVTLTAQALRASAPDGPFNAAFGIAPVDADGVALASYDLDSDANGSNDRARVATVPLRFGRLRLMNAIGAAERTLALPLAAQHWDGSGWADNTLDSCTRIAASAVNFGNYRRSLTPSDTAVVGNSVTVSAGRASLTLAAPAAGRSGTVDVALSLGSSATDASCLQTWTPGSGDAASAGAGLAHLRGAWCGSTYDRDPAARASFGLRGGASPFIQRREHY